MLEEFVELFSAGRDILPPCCLADSFVCLLSTELVCHYPPQRIQRFSIFCHVRIRGRQPGAGKDSHLRLDASVPFCFLQDTMNFGACLHRFAIRWHVGKCLNAIDKVIERDETVGFAAAKPGFHLDNPMSVLTAEAFQGVYQQRADAACQIGLVEETDRIAVASRAG